MAYVAKINGYVIKDAEARADLADEITARQSADTALGGRIDDEITARRSADTALGGKIGDLSELTTTATADLVAAINELDSHADTNASDISTIIGNDTGKSMREVAQEVSATVYTPQGSCTFANLPSLSASSTKVGFVYDVIDSFTTTSDFKEGAGIDVPGGTNVVVADVSGTKMWDLLGFNIDLSPYQKKAMSSSVSVGGVPQTTVEGAIGALANLPVDTVENGDMHPVTSNAVYDKFASIAAVDSITNGDLHPVTSNAVYNKLNTVTQGSATIVSSKVGATGEDCFIRFYKVGKIAMVNYKLYFNATPNFLEDIATGLPNAITMTWAACNNFQGLNSKPINWQVNTDGMLRSDNGSDNIVANESVYGSFVYITAD